MGRRQSDRITLTRKADRLFSIFIRSRDGKCVSCGHSDRLLQCAHVMSRRYRSTRWNPENASALCRNCHYWQTIHPLEAEDFWRGFLGNAKYNALRRKALQPWNRDLDSVLAWLEGAVSG